MSSKYYFLGRFPAFKEVGGVTTFTYDFANKFKNLTYLDFYPAKNKIVPEDVDVEFFNRNLIVRLVKLWLLFFKKKGGCIFNFSSCSSLLIIFFLPKLGRQKWVLILHNGDQEGNFQKLNFIAKAIVKFALRKIDLLCAISNKQYDFYKKNKTGKVLRISPYIKKNTVQKKGASFKHSILITGFPTRIYRLRETLEILNILWDEGYRFEVNVCLYGFDIDGIRLGLEEYMECLPFVSYYSHLSGEEFDSVLQKSSIYLRMNSVDSFGLVIAEAIDRGLKVIATDVCERYPGSYLLSADDFIGLKKALVSYFHSGEFGDTVRVQQVNDEAVEFEEIVNYLFTD